MRPARQKGKLVVFEGTDGSGKATQAKLLAETLKFQQIPYKTIEFPRYGKNPYGNLIGKYLTGNFGAKESVDARLLALAYAGDRMLAKPSMKKWLEAGFLVIADRYVPSSQAYMSAKLPKKNRKEFVKWLNNLEYNINGMPREDIIMYLTSSLDLSFSNVAKKDKRGYIQGTYDIHEKDVEYQKEVGKAYRTLARLDPRWAIVNCAAYGSMKSAELIHRKILSILRMRQIV